MRIIVIAFLELYFEEEEWEDIDNLIAELTPQVTQIHRFDNVLSMLS